jgi:SAM-dependent methyltransferase
MHRPEPIASATLVDQSYWDQAYTDLQPTMAPADDPVRQWIEATLPPAQGDRHCLEVGCYPGRYLAAIGRMGYVVHGVDLTPAIARMPSAFTRQGIRVGEFVHGDFLTMALPREYDVVCSFGFIEHFTEWRNVLLKHADLVAPGGLLLIETPNFKGWVQRMLHEALDATNLRRHHIPAMDPGAWAAALRQHGFEIRSQGHLGRFDLWTDSPPPNAFQRVVHRVVRMLSPALRRVRTGSAALSPYCVLVAQRRAAGPPRPDA